MRGLKFIAVAAMMFAFTSSALAQTSRGYFVGNVLDQNGAVVKITNTRTGVTHVATSTDEGRFRFDAIEPGTYRVEISRPGFKTITRNGLIIGSNQTTTANFRLYSKR